MHTVAQESDMIKRYAAMLLLVLAVSPAIMASGLSDAELCASVETIHGSCDSKLLNPAAIDELPRLVAAECRPGTRVTVALPSDRPSQRALVCYVMRTTSVPLRRAWLRLVRTGQSA